LIFLENRIDFIVTLCFCQHSAFTQPNSPAYSHSTTFAINLAHWPRCPLKRHPATGDTRDRDIFALRILPSPDLTLEYFWTPRSHAVVSKNGYLDGAQSLH
jgi:hypothetical protein